MPERSFGYRKSTPDARDEKYRYYLAPATLAALPPQGNVSALFPPAYEQGKLGSCVAWATKSLMCANYARQGMNDPDLSALMLYYLGREAIWETHLDNGCTPRDVLKGATSIGVCKEAFWPYRIEKFAERPGLAAYQDAQYHKIMSYHAMAQSLDMMRGCIAEGYPFSVGVIVHENFPLQIGIQDIPMPAGAEIGGHDIVIVGYDDHTGKFLVRNSWGTGWGLDGYATIPYDYLVAPALAGDLWTVRMVDPNDPDNSSMPVAPQPEGCLAAILRLFGG